jgi:nudix-type nucleoside diphosphatase (YffH/AdpP family)
MSESEDEATFEARVLHLDGNPRVQLQGVEVLADDHYVLRKITFDIEQSGGNVERQSREAYDRGHGAAILLYDAAAGTVLLTRQFRMPPYVAGHPDGMMLEAPAGLLEDEDAESAIRREAQEETGVEVGEVERLWQVFMSPGSVTEHLTLFAAPYVSADQDDARGGVADEGEDIEIVELAFDEALAQIGTGIVDAKTIMLLQWAAGTGRLRAS